MKHFFDWLLNRKQESVRLSPVIEPLPHLNAQQRRDFWHAEARRILGEARAAIAHNNELAAIELEKANAPYVAEIRRAEAMYEQAKREDS
jgi:hypothetical protein